MDPQSIAMLMMRAGQGDPQAIAMLEQSGITPTGLQNWGQGQSLGDTLSGLPQLGANPDIPIMGQEQFADTFGGQAPIPMPNPEPNPLEAVRPEAFPYQETDPTYPPLTAPPASGPRLGPPERMTTTPPAGNRFPNVRMPEQTRPIFSGGVAGAQKAPDFGIRAGVTPAMALMQAIMGRAQRPQSGQGQGGGGLGDILNARN